MWSESCKLLSCLFLVSLGFHGILLGVIESICLGLGKIQNLSRKYVLGRYLIFEDNMSIRMGDEKSVSSCLSILVIRLGY